MMNESKEKILKMLQDGSITSEEADRMLLAFENTGWEEPGEDQPSKGSDEALSSPDDVVAKTMPLSDAAPDFEALRDSWPSLVRSTLALMATFFIISMALRRSTRGVLKFGGTLLLSLVLLAALVAAYIWSSRDGLWLHVRIQSEDGSRFRISLPLSTRLVRWGMQIGRKYTDEKTQEYLDIFDDLITAWEQDPNQDPVFIGVDDGGDKVQLYIG